VLIGGLISAIAFRHSKNPRPGSPTKYAMFDLEDTAGIMRCILWASEYVTYGEQVQPDALVAIRGTIDKRPGSDNVNLICNEIIPVAELEQRYTRGVRLRVSERDHGDKKLEDLRNILRGYPGNCAVELVLELTDGLRVLCKTGSMKVQLNAEMRDRVDELLGPGCVKPLAAPVKLNNGNGNGNGRGHWEGRKRGG
jgi:DNA polymerase-3 subunit alpha